MIWLVSENLDHNLSGGMNRLFIVQNLVQWHTILNLELARVVN